MDRTAFEAGLSQDGFLETVERTLPPGEATPEHSHPFDARLLILVGELSLEHAGARIAHGPGAVFDVPRDTPHAEIAGAEGAHYIAGRRR